WMSQAHPLRYTILRYFNAAGADANGQIGESHVPETHLIPLICQAALSQGTAGAGEPLTVFGTDYDTRDGTAVRDYVHVDDLATAHVLALKRLLAGGLSRVYNLGSGAGVTVLEMLKAAETVMGKPVPHGFGPRRAGDPPVLVADIRRAVEDLGWQPRQSDLETLIRTA